jgi:hypothetical protein
MDVQSLVYLESNVPPYSVGVASDFIQAGCNRSIGQIEEALELAHGGPRDQVNLDESTGHSVSIYSFLAVQRHIRADEANVANHSEHIRRVVEAEVQQEGIARRLVEVVR